LDLVTVQLLFVSSALLAYNRENVTGVYYTLGLFIPLALFAISFYTAKSKEINEDHFKKLGYLYVILALSLVFYQYKLALLALGLLAIAYYITKSDHLDEKRRNASQTCVATMMAFMLIYVETRFTILSLGILMLFLLDKKTYQKDPDKKRTKKLILYPLLLVLFGTVFFSDYRIYGFAVNRKMIFWTLSYEPELVLFSSVIAFVFTLLYSRRNEDVPFIYGLPIAAVMATIPVLISQSSNTIDWIMLSTLCVGVAMSLYNYFVNKELGIIIFQYCAFAWLIMSWGAWAGAASMLFFGATESILDKEWNFLKSDNSDAYSELSRLTILTILPIGMWFAWWATMGQTDGLVHTRDIDPGNLILRGGYIGDRISPSNEWVGFMGAGPVILVGILFWNLFRMNKWPIHFAFMALLVRAAFLSMQLSITPDFPRILFKISWDLFFCLLIAGTILFYMLYDKWFVQNVPEQSSGM